ncbi:MAG: DNA cytosine methyltransferase [Candidatus Desulforudis sp.]|nr:DNA cytosine methyltransferase [Desulforudis sp.]
MDIHSGSAAVADPRIPLDNERPDPPPIIISLDGTWHRPLTTLELAALQGFPTILPNGQPLTLAGRSDSRWRERIGNAVPPPAAKAIGDQILRALLLSAFGTWELGTTPLWVVPDLPWKNDLLVNR